MLGRCKLPSPRGCWFVDTIPHLDPSVAHRRAFCTRDPLAAAHAVPGRPDPPLAAAQVLRVRPEPPVAAAHALPAHPDPPCVAAHALRVHPEPPDVAAQALRARPEPPLAAAHALPARPEPPPCAAPEHRRESDACGPSVIMLEFTRVRRALLLRQSAILVQGFLGGERQPSYYEGINRSNAVGIGISVEDSGEGRGKFSPNLIGERSVNALLVSPNVFLELT